MTEPRMVTVTVFEDDDEDNRVPEWPNRLIDFMAWLAVKFTEVPEQYRQTARFDLFGTKGSGVLMSISYERPETPEDVAKREKWAKDWVDGIVKARDKFADKFGP